MPDNTGKKECKKDTSKKNPCTDCLQCQWCSDQRCSKCRPSGNVVIYEKKSVNCPELQKLAKVL